MRWLALSCLLSILCNTLSAQYVYTIKADSVKITNCDSAELILENHTQNIAGFLFNTGSGRTIFKRALQPLGSNAWVIGADTLNLGANAWLQGGNRFGATGVLGTLDNNNLDLYTADTQRVRVVPRGRMLVGTTTDDSAHLLQVHGTSAFSGNMNIGSATITNAGSLIGTNAILFNHVVSQIPSFQENDIYISKLDNVLYNYQYRFHTTQNTTNNILTLDIKIPQYELSDTTGIVYPGGKMCFSFWEHYIPQLISVLMIDTATQQSYGPFTTSTNLAPGNSGYFEITIPQTFNNINEIRIVMTPPPGGLLDFQNVEYVLSNPGSLSNPFPYVSKFGNERLYSFLLFGTGGNTITRLSPLADSATFFLSNVGIGTSTPQYPLDVTGDVNIGGTGQLRMFSHRSGINATCLSTHLYNGCGSAGYITLGFSNASGTASGIPDPLTVSQKVMSVGINTINPLAKLQVTGGDTSASSSSFLVINAMGKESFRVFDDGRVRLASVGNDSSQTRVLVSDDSGYLYYRSAASLALDNPVRSSLAVNGTIKSKKIIISPDEWADYVFDSTYRLPRLTEVEAYIHREHHLPGILSAAAVQKNGLDVGANQAALLKKIEELTLYNIEQSKKLDEQNKKLESEDEQLANQRLQIQTLQQEIEQIKQLLQSKPTLK